MLWDQFATIHPLKAPIPTGQTHTHAATTATMFSKRRWRCACTCGAEGNGRTKGDALYSLSLRPCTLEPAHV